MKRSTQMGDSVQRGRKRASSPFVSVPFVAASFGALAVLASCTEPVMTPPPPFPTATAPMTTGSAQATPTAAPDSIETKPTLASAKAFEPPAPEVVKLPSGITVWLLSRHTLPLVSISLALPVGSANDPAGKEGLASITADMLDEGAGSRSAIDVSTALQDLGVSLRTGTTLDGTTLSLTVLKRNFAQAFGIMADVLARPRFDDKEYKRVSDLWRNSLLKRADDPNSVARVVGQVAAYGRNHPYGHPTDGFISSAKTIELSHVKEFYQTHYRPEKVVLAVVGDITKEEIASSVKDALGTWQPAPPTTPPPVPTAPAKAPRPVLVLVDRPDAPQSVIAVVGEGIRLSDPEAPLYELVNTAVGGSFTSRLNQNLREDHGWTYGAGSAFTETRLGGAFVARAAVETKFTGPALDEMVKELIKMAASGPTEDEASKVKAQDRADLVQAYESAGGIAGRYAMLSTLGLPSGHDAAASRARQAATLEALKKIAGAVDPSKATIVVVGPANVVKPALAKFGEPVLWDAEGSVTAAPPAAPATPTTSTKKTK